MRVMTSVFAPAVGPRRPVCRGRCAVRFWSSACPRADSRRQAPAQPREPRPGRERSAIDEAVALALEQNLDLQVERINPQCRTRLSVARSDWTPNFRTSIDLRNQTQPPHDTFCRQRAARSSATIVDDFGVHRRCYAVGRQLPGRAGTTRAPPPTTSSPTSTRSSTRPSAPSYTQPLLRNFKIDATRQQLLRQPEEPRDLGRAAAAVDRADRRGTCRNAY